MDEKYLFRFKKGIEDSIAELPFQIFQGETNEISFEHFDILLTKCFLELVLLFTSSEERKL